MAQIGICRVKYADYRDSSEEKGDRFSRNRPSKLAARDGGVDFGGAVGKGLTGARRKNAHAGQTGNDNQCQHYRIFHGCGPIFGQQKILNGHDNLPHT